MMRSVPLLGVLAVSVAASFMCSLPTARAAPSADDPAQGRPATIQMIVPAEAQITFDGTPTSSRGTLRTFVSPPLAPGKQYHYYNVRVRSMANGQKLDETICICVREGDAITISYPSGAFTERRAYYYGAEPTAERANSYYYGPDPRGRVILYHSDYPPPPKIQTLSEQDPIQGIPFPPG
jgi:uncharacterized protein (TIGR03000 family)